jgi:hypothetical protein
MRLFIILTVLFITSVASADVYVAYNPQGLIYGLSEQNDMVIPEGYTIKILNGIKAKDLTLAYDVSLYDFNGSDFVVNQSRMAEYRAKQEEAQKVADDEKLIQNQIRKNAYETLKGSGVKFNKLKDSDFSK